MVFRVGVFGLRFNSIAPRIGSLRAKFVELRKVRLQEGLVGGLSHANRERRVFWIRDGSLREAGASMDNLLSNAGSEISEPISEIVDKTGATFQRAADGDERT